MPGKTLRAVNRGGNWNNGTNNGVFYFNANNARSNSNDNIGGRSALAYKMLSPEPTGEGSERVKGAYLPTGGHRPPVKDTAGVLMPSVRADSVARRCGRPRRLSGRSATRGYFLH